MRNGILDDADVAVLTYLHKVGNVHELYVPFITEYGEPVITELMNAKFIKRFDDRLILAPDSIHLVNRIALAMLLASHFEIFIQVGIFDLDETLSAVDDEGNYLPYTWEDVPDPRFDYNLSKKFKPDVSFLDLRVAMMGWLIHKVEQSVPVEDFSILRTMFLVELRKRLSVDVSDSFWDVVFKTSNLGEIVSERFDQAVWWEELGETPDDADEICEVIFTAGLRELRRRNSLHPLFDINPTESPGNVNLLDRLNIQFELVEGI